MSLLFIDGFDHVGHFESPAPRKWPEGGGFILQDGTARTGLGFYTTGEGSGINTKTFAPGTTSVVVGFAIRCPNLAGSTFGYNICEVLEGTTIHLALYITATGTVGIKLGGTSIAAGTIVCPANNWAYIELKANISDTGSYEVKVNGVSDAALTNAGPVDTRNGGTGQWNRIRISGGHSGANSHFDDFYVCDTNGAAPRNTFLGLVKVETLMPQTDAVAVGSNTGLTPSTGTDHGALVDEIPPNTTDYNSSATVGLKDTYQYPPMTLSGTVLGIQTNLFVQKSDAAARTVCAVVRSGGVDSDGANVAPNTTFSYFSEIRPVNTNGGAEWTTAAIATLEAGMKVTA